MHELDAAYTASCGITSGRAGAAAHLAGRQTQQGARELLQHSLNSCLVSIAHPHLIQELLQLRMINCSSHVCGSR